MVGAIGLNLWYFQNRGPTPSWLDSTTQVTQIAIAIHCMEAVIAAIVALRSRQSPFAASIQTFFTGAFGLKEYLAAARNHSPAE